MTAQENAVCHAILEEIKNSIRVQPDKALTLANTYKAIKACERQQRKNQS